MAFMHVTTTTNRIPGGVGFPY